MVQPLTRSQKLSAPDRSAHPSAEIPQKALLIANNGSTRGDHFYEVKGNDRGTPLRVKAGQVFWIVLKNNGKFAHEISWGRNLIDKGNYYDGYRENLLENVQVKITGEKFRLVANGLPDFYLHPGQEAELEMTLPAEVLGEWEMGCFRPNHYESGMHLKFIVE